MRTVPTCCTLLGSDVLTCALYLKPWHQPEPSKLTGMGTKEVQSIVAAILQLIARTVCVEFVERMIGGFCCICNSVRRQRKNWIINEWTHIIALCTNMNEVWSRRDDRRLTTKWVISQQGEGVSVVDFLLSILKLCVHYSTVATVRANTPGVLGEPWDGSKAYHLK